MVIVILFGILPLILMWIINKNNKQDTTDSKVEKKTITEPALSFLSKVTSKIDWQKVGDKKYETTNAYTVKRNFTGGLDKENWTKVLDIGGTKDYLKLDSENYSFEYNKIINKRSEIEKGSLSDNEIGTIFYKNVNSLLNDNKLEIKIDNFLYKQFLYPWWVASTEKESVVTEVVANYYFNNLPIFTPTGYPIKTDFFKNGKIIKVIGILPFGEVDKTEKNNLLAVDKIKNIEPNNFLIWSVDGGRDYELSEKTPKIEDISVESYRLGYILSDNGILWPYYFFNGSSNLSTGAAKIVFIISAVEK